MSWLYLAHVGAFAGEEKNNMISVSPLFKIALGMYFSLHALLWAGCLQWQYKDIISLVCVEEWGEVILCYCGICIKFSELLFRWGKKKLGKLGGGLGVGKSQDTLLSHAEIRYYDKNPDTQDAFFPVTQFHLFFHGYIFITWNCLCQWFTVSFILKQQTTHMKD